MLHDQREVQVQVLADNEQVVASVLLLFSPVSGSFANIQ